jgi:hypothetical protein
VFGARAHAVDASVYAAADEASRAALYASATAIRPSVSPDVDADEGEGGGMSEPQQLPDDGDSSELSDPPGGVVLREWSTSRAHRQAVASVMAAEVRATVSELSAGRPPEGEVVTLDLSALMTAGEQAPAAMGVARGGPSTREAKAAEAAEAEAVAQAARAAAAAELAARAAAERRADGGGGGGDDAAGNAVDESGVAPAPVAVAATSWLWPFGGASRKTVATAPPPGQSPPPPLPPPQALPGAPAQPRAAACCRGGKRLAPLASAAPGSPAFDQRLTSV